MKKLVFLGSGSAFTVGADNFQSNILIIDENNNKFLIDCGTDIRFSLYAQGFSHKDITDIYISHLHSDHSGGLEYIAFTTRFDAQCIRPSLYLSSHIASELWENSLAAGLRSIQGDQSTIDDYFIMERVSEEQGYFFWQGIKFDLVEVIHVDTGSYLMPSYGLFFTLNGLNIFFTTDTQLCLSKLQFYYDNADIIFQDCEMLPIPTSVHASFEELKLLPPEIKRKMWLYGYQPVALPDAAQSGFLGFVSRGQIFEF
jgi:ribonuclease BN (tRNA processing enzyme)